MSQIQQRTPTKWQISRIKLGLCALGIMVCMAILASATPLNVNHFGGLNAAHRATALGQSSGTAQAMAPIYTIQAAAAASQGGSFYVQGSVYPNPIDTSQDPPPAQITNPTPTSDPFPCFTCGPNRMCPLMATGCRCGGPIRAYCALEE